MRWMHGLGWRRIRNRYRSIPCSNRFKVYCGLDGRRIDRPLNAKYPARRIYKAASVCRWKRHREYSGSTKHAQGEGEADLVCTIVRDPSPHRFFRIKVDHISEVDLNLSNPWPRITVGIKDTIPKIQRGRLGSNGFDHRKVILIRSSTECINRNLILPHPLVRRRIGRNIRRDNRDLIQQSIHRPRYPTNSKAREPHANLGILPELMRARDEQVIRADDRLSNMKILNVNICAILGGSKSVVVLDRILSEVEEVLRELFFSENLSSR